MSKHVSLQSSAPRSVSSFYCVDGDEVTWSGPHARNFFDLTMSKLIELAHGSFLDESVAIANLQYLLRLDHILKLIDTKQTHLLESDLSNARYLGRRPRTCCSETSSGGLARGKSDAS